MVRDMQTVAGRALRALPRQRTSLTPALFTPIFFYVVNVASLEHIASLGQVPFEEFYLPVSIVVVAVTGASRAGTFVGDIATGYFDKLCVTPVRRSALLFGLMIADFVVVACLSVPVLLIGIVHGVRFESGVLGILLFILLASLWGLAFAGFPYALALRTGNPAVVTSAFTLFFSVAYLTTAFVPRDLLAPWLRWVSDGNPLTYLLEGLRSLVIDGWDGQALLVAMLTVFGVGLVSMTLALRSLSYRVRVGTQEVY
ncbi:MAG: ABC transporter permease [bacterium]|nr:ABC transporter permease [bacterium]MDE0412250.1 ABC transporter permease [Gammaproteobacteria bacterium]